MTWSHGTHDGYANHGCRCSPCVEAEHKHKKNQYQKHKKRYREEAASRYKANPNPTKEASSRWYSENREYAQKRQREYENANRSRRRDNRYGLNPGEYDQRLVEQGNACAICKEPFGENNIPRVDHDHSCCSGKTSCGSCVRGLLCHKCNTFLGLAGDNPALLAVGVSYLKGDLYGG